MSRPSFADRQVDLGAEWLRLARRAR
jgi:hypothetical protein